MPDTEKLARIFNIFHDGTIHEATQHGRDLTLQISCLYLAERINPEFDKFYLKLTEVSTFRFDAWDTPDKSDIPLPISPTEIGAAKLEILSAEVKGDEVFVTCNQANSAAIYAGGEIVINCEQFQLYDQSMAETSIEILIPIWEKVWAEWKSKN